MYNYFIGLCNPKDAFLSKGVSNEEIWERQLFYFIYLFRFIFYLCAKIEFAFSTNTIQQHFSVN